MRNKEKILLVITEPCLNPEFPQERLRNYHAQKICVFLRGPYDMEGHAKKCVGRYCELANKTTQTTLQSIHSMHW